ncbi:hypothetical protein [Planosporangium mesophilum]|uniref:Uncharacterized protein n=1 Tax=Planosporangium mesophilum TaxID=689768 RepID=A0A8J3X4A7_9ACTN|nr:hypothetical protein [Planosporangium mesophilum]NJC86742.1 hypothetical protein [Planosporangium mesophilum]GII26419.1 hypothetical protein Pme01_60160 [Planosporangium mesophilum]
MSTEAADRDAYVDAFLRLARDAVAGDLATWDGALETLEVDYETAGGAHAVALVRFRGRSYRYRRRIWPPDHPAALKAAIYATALLEDLLTRPPTAASDPGTAVTTI